MSEQQREFSQADAQALLNIAQDAPIPGGQREAVYRTQLYQRFVAFFEKNTKPDEAPAVLPPKRRGRPAAASTTEAPSAPVADVSAEDVTK